MSIESPTEKDNLIKWSGLRRHFFEVYWIVLRLSESPLAAWVSYALSFPKKGAPSAAIRMSLFDTESQKCLQNFETAYPMSQVMMDREIPYVQVGESSIFHKGCRGLLQKGRDSVEWDFSSDSVTKTLRHFSSHTLYNLPIKTKILTPHPQAFYHGSLRYNHKTYTFNQASGHQSHAWGSTLPPLWQMVHCHQFQEDPEAFLEGVGFQHTWAKLKWAPFTLSLKTSTLSCRIFSILRPSVMHPNSWHFEFTKGRRKIIGHIFAPESQFSSFIAQTPSGEERDVRETPLADCRIEILKRSGLHWTLEKVLTAKGSCALQVGRIIPRI